MLLRKEDLPCDNESSRWICILSEDSVRNWWILGVVVVVVASNCDPGGDLRAGNGGDPGLRESSFDPIIDRVCSAWSIFKLDQKHSQRHQFHSWQKELSTNTFSPKRKNINEWLGKNIYFTNCAFLRNT